MAKIDINPIRSLSMTLPSISVIIPVKNEAMKIRRCIEGILNQSIPVLEIIVVDSGSTDGTVEILSEYEAVRLIQITSDEFNHGTTRNLGVSKAKGDYCLLTVGDAWPCDDRWIERLLEGMVNEDVVAVCGMQVVPHHRDKNPVEWFRPVSEPKIETIRLNEAEFKALSPSEQKRMCSWDDVTALYKREVLLTIPFRKTSYAEDALWAKDAILHGFSISYNKAARVYHYHKADPEFAFNRSFTVFYHMFKYFGMIPDKKKTGLKQALSLMKIIAFTRGISFSERFYWLRYNLKLKKNIYKASERFRQLHRVGEDELDRFHQREFSKPPVPLKN